jgi:hypothetical protein
MLNQNVSFLIYNSASTLIFHLARRAPQLKKSQIIIKRPQHKPKTIHHPRGHISDDITSSPQVEPPLVASTSARPSTSSTRLATSTSTSGPEEELKHIRSLLVPPLIPGVPDWGVPPELAAEEYEPCDPAIEVWEMIDISRFLLNFW